MIKGLDNAQYFKKYYLENAEKFKIYFENYRKNNSEKVKESYKKWKLNNPERHKEANKKYRQNNKLKWNFDISIWRTIRDKNGHCWEELVNFTLQDLKEYLEKLWKPGMSWDNYGKFGWEIDHIIPISLWEFDSYNDREFKQCWALCNLQPLWVEENKKKKARIEN